MPPNELMIGSVEKKFIDELLHNYNQLANESKKKFPNVKEACETGIMRVRNTASSPAIIASAGFRNSLINESAQMMEPFFMGCDTKSPKLVQISLNAIQKAILFECLNVQAATNLINCLWNLMEHGLEEVKVLQTITLLITMNHLVQDEQLAKALSLCFRLNYTKNSTIKNTASATVRQLTTIIFERVQPTEKCENSLNQSDDHQDESIQKKLFDIVPCDNDSCRYIPINLKSAALDAFYLMQDLIQIVNGETPFWLKNIPEISKIFGLELLELVIDQYPQIFHEYEEFSFLLKEKICQLVIKLFSPNIKQRSHLLLNPWLKEWSSNNLNINNNKNNNNNNGGNTVNTNNNNNNNNSAQSFQPPIWSTTVRLMRIVSVLIKNYFEILITESEIFLSLLIKSLEVDKFNWQRLIALEAIFRMICPKILCSLCQNYDMKPQSSKILRDIVNALCIFIQSQFQVVDSSTTQSLIASLVNNNNSGNSNITNAYNNLNNHSSNNNSTGPITLNRTNNNNNNQNHFPTFNLRGIAISLLFIPMDKEYRYKTFYIDQLDKQESPVAPEGHGLSTAVACVFEIVTALVKTIETDLDITIQTKDRGSAVKPISMENYNQEMVELHRQMLVSTFGGLIGTFSLLLDASADDVITGLVLEQMQKLIIIYGLYKVDVARDSLLISICKSSLPSNYYSIPALNPDDLPLEDNSNASKQPETLSKSANVGLISFRSMSSVGINLPNLLSQQNNHPLTNNQASKTANLTHIENNSTGSHSNDSSKQVIAVGTPLPNNNQTNPSQQQGPVMLNAKNLLCMSSIMQVSMTYAFVYEEKSWHIVFTTLQHLVWILGMKPNNINLYKLNQNYQNQSLMISGSGQNPPNSNIDQSYQDEATTASSDLPVLTAMLSRLFECTQNISDDSLMTMMKALITLSNEAMEVAYNNREPSLFAIVKIHESALVNLKRVDLFWELITSHLIQVSSHPYHKLRECGVEVLCNLVKSVLNFIHLKRKNENDRDGSKEDTGTLSEPYYMSALQQLSEIKFIDIRQKQIECLLRILQSHGEDMIDGWPIVLNIIETACIPQNEKLIKHAFQCYEFVVSNLLRFIPSIHLIHCINAAVSFGSQVQELNVSLSAVGLIWNLADFLYSNQQKIQTSIEQYAENGHEFVNVDLPFCENLTPMQSLWISLFKNLGNLCTDARLSVRKSSVQTLMSTLSKHGQILDYNTWKAIFFYVLFPLIDSVRALCALASNEKITQSESSKPNSYEEDSEYIIHYSRNTAFKQWCETQVSVINGVSRILTIKLDMLIINILSNQKDDHPITNESDSNPKELTDSETILLNIWSLFFEFVYTSAVCTNSEVSMSAMKCFNETIKYLNEYQKNCTNNLLDIKKENAQKVQKLLTLIWKIVWKTWYNIGHNVSVEKVVNSESNASNSGDEMQINHAQLQHHHRGTVFIPSQQFLCLLINPLFTIFNCNLSQFTESDFKNMSFIIQNVVALPFDVMNETCSYHHHHHHHHHGSNEHLLTSLQSEVISTLENIQDLMINNLTQLNYLIPLMFHQNLAFSLYAVNIVPPNLNVFISSQNQHRFLPGELTTFKSMSYYIFGEIALKNAFNLYQFTYGEMIVIKSHILHSMIKAYKIPLCFKYSCPLQSTWKYAVNYFIKTLELGLPLARRFPNDFSSIWADLALTFEGFLFPVNKPPTNQKLEDQQLDEALDVKVVELIRDHIMIHAQKIPKEFLLQIVSILNRGSIHSPSITSIETEVNRKLREDFARICFQTLLQFSFFGPKGNPDLFIQSKTNGSNDKSPEQTIGIVNKLAVASILKRFNDVIIKYVEDEQLCPCPLPRHRLSEISFVLKALATLISSLKQAPAGVVENHVWQQLIELYPRIVDCTMSNSPQVNNSIREVLHQYSCMLTCPKPGASSSSSLANRPVEPSGNSATNTTAVEAKSMMKMTSKDKIAKPPKSFQQNGNNEINI